ncbi:MAG: 4-hydroxy-tetrahydrodipicolinate synthase [Acidimicrobiia bacterium]
MHERPHAPFGRVLTAIITPFTPDGSVDYATFWRLIAHLGANGSDGIVVCGTTGEAPTLSRAEKGALFKAAVDAAGDKLTVVAGVGTYDTAASVDLAVAAREAGVDGVMAVTPYYSKPPQAGIIAHMTAIADAADLPMMIYNIPGRTATRIEIDTLGSLATHPGIVAVKDAVDDIAWSRDAIDQVSELAVYSGSDSQTKAIVEAGGVGVVSVSSHLAGREIAAMVQAVFDRDDSTASELDDLVRPLTEALFAEPSPMPLKAALSRYWDHVGEPRLPLLSASGATVEAVGKAMDAIATHRSR